MGELPKITPEMLAALRAFTRNADWALDHRELLVEHLGKFVAVLDEQIVGVSDDSRKLRRRFAGRKDLYMTFVEPPGRPRVLALG